MELTCFSPSEGSESRDMTERSRTLLERLDADTATLSAMNEPKVEQWDKPTLVRLLDGIGRSPSTANLYFPVDIFHPSAPCQASFENEQDHQQALMAWERGLVRRRVLSAQFCLRFQYDKATPQICAGSPGWDVSDWDPVWQQVDLLKRTAIRVGSEFGSYLGTATSIAEIRDPRLRSEIEKRCPLYFEICSLIRRVDPMPLSPELGKSRLDLLRQAGLDIKVLLDDDELSLDQHGDDTAALPSGTPALVAPSDVMTAAESSRAATPAASMSATAAAADSIAAVAATTAEEPTVDAIASTVTAKVIVTATATPATTATTTETTVTAADTAVTPMATASTTTMAATPAVAATSSAATAATGSTKTTGATEVAGAAAATGATARTIAGTSTAASATAANATATNVTAVVDATAAKVTATKIAATTSTADPTARSRVTATIAAAIAASIAALPTAATPTAAALTAAMVPATSTSVVMTSAAVARPAASTVSARPTLSMPGSQGTVAVVPSARKADADVRAVKRPRPSPSAGSNHQRHAATSAAIRLVKDCLSESTDPISRSAPPGVIARQTPPSGPPAPARSAARTISRYSDVRIPKRGSPASAPCSASAPAPLPPPDCTALHPTPPRRLPASPIRPSEAASSAPPGPPSPPPTAVQAATAQAAPQSTACLTAAEGTVLTNGRNAGGTMNSSADDPIDLTADDSDDESDDDIWEFVPISSSPSELTRVSKVQECTSRTGTAGMDRSRVGRESTKSQPIDLTGTQSTDVSDEVDIWEVLPVRSQSLSAGANEAAKTLPRVAEVVTDNHRPDCSGQDPPGQQKEAPGASTEPRPANERDQGDIRDQAPYSSPRQLSPTDSAESMDIIPPTPAGSERGPAVLGAAGNSKELDNGSPTPPTRIFAATAASAVDEVSQTKPSSPASTESRCDSRFCPPSLPPMDPADPAANRRGFECPVPDHGWSQRRASVSSRATSMAPTSGPVEGRTAPYAMARSFSGPGRYPDLRADPSPRTSARPRDAPLRRSAPYTQLPPLLLRYRQIIADLEAAVAPTFLRSWLTPNDRHQFEAANTPDGQRDDIVSQARNSLVLDAVNKSHDVAFLLRGSPIASTAFVVPHRRGRMVMASALRQLILTAGGEAFDSVTDAASVCSRRLQRSKLVEIVFSRPDVFAPATSAWPVRDHRVVFVDDFLRDCAEAALLTLRSERD